MRERVRGQGSAAWLIVLCDRPMDSVENSTGVTNYFSALALRLGSGLRGHHAVSHDGEHAPNTCRAQGGREVRCGNG